MPKTDNTRVIAEIKAKTDCGDLYRESFPHLCQGNGTNYRCVWHDDQNPSLQPFPDHLFCHAEGKRYDVFDVMKQANDCSFKKAKALLAERCGIAPPTVVEEYVYEDADDKPYMKVVRLSNKVFPQYHYNADKRTWVKGLGGRQPILYRLPKLTGADTIWITEGEKDVHTLESLGFVATTSPMGAGKWHLVCKDGKPPEVLSGKTIVICGDTDEKGRRHVAQVAASLYGHTSSIKVIEVPQDKDVSEYVAVVGIEQAREKLLELVASAQEYEPRLQSQNEKAEPKEEEEGRRPNKFKRLLATFEETTSTVFLDQYGTAWACMEIAGHHENLRLNSPAFQRHLLKRYVAICDEGVGRETMTQVTDVLTARAEETRSLFNRFAWLNGKLYIDLVWPDWFCIEVDATGWRKVQLTSPPFRRHAHQQALPDPQPGGHVGDLLDFLALTDEAAQILLLVWLCTAPLEHIPRPGITLHGLQGSTKSTAQEIIRSLLDPSSTPLLSLPKDSAEFVQIMNHHAVVSIENLGKLPAWASDGFCRGSTGGGFSKRKLYSDDEDVIYSFRRTFLMNGINIPGTRPDLLDRTILIELPRIPEDDRVEKVEVFRRFEEARPKIFGAMLDVLTAAMNLRGSIELTRLPRMADWCRWGCAVAEALGIDHRRFLDAYYKSIGYQHEEIVSAEPICQVLLRFMEDQSEWEGEPAELYRKLKGIGEEMDLTKEGFPKAPHTMTRKLNGLAHNLAEVGLKVTVSKGTRRIISIRKETSERIPAKASLPSKRLQTNQEADSEQDATSTLSADAENSAGGNAPDSLDKRRCDASDAFSGSPGGLNPDDCKFCDQFQQGWCRHATEKISTMRECPLGNEIPF